MDDANISKIIQSGEHLSRNRLHLGSWHSNKQRAFGVVIQINVEHFCDYKKVSAESEAFMYFENIVFVAISLIDYLKHFSFSLGVLDALSAFLADLNGNFSSLLFLINALYYLTKASCS